WFSGAGTAGTIHPELFGLNGFELSVWQLVAPTGPPRRVWELSLPWRSVRISAAPFGTVFVLSADGALHLLRRVERDHLIVRAGGLTVPLEHPTLYRGGVPYLSAADWAKLLGLSLHPSQGGRRLVIWRGERFLLVTPGDDRALLNGRRTSLGAAALEANGVVYLPLGITQLFGEPVTWDPLHRSIDLPRPLPGAMLLP
ncbi:MAG TPA: copper amine oxidase N-terminal domain-containing protein, partial [Limnochordia bacterium]